MNSTLTNLNTCLSTARVASRHNRTNRFFSVAPAVLPRTVLAPTRRFEPLARSSERVAAALDVGGRRFGEDMGQIGLRIDGKHFLGCDQRGQNCPMFATAIGAGERMARSTTFESISTRPSSRSRGSG